MRRVLALAVALAASPFALAQKWVDEKGRVYYGEPPKDIKVRPAEIKGGGSGVATTEDLQRQPAGSGAAGAGQAGQPSGQARAGRMVEYVPDRQGGPRDPSQK